MIPVPPFDPALPALATLFDASAVIPLLNGGPGPGAGMQVTGYRPRYVRYKPGASCLVQADLDVRDAAGQTTTERAHLQLYVDDRGARRAESSRLIRLRERARATSPDLPWGGASYLPEIGALLQICPIDYELRYLARAADPAWMAAEIGAALDDSTIALAGQPQLIRYKPERKALFRYDLDHGPHERLYGKLLADNRGVNLARVTLALIGGGVTTPPVVIALPQRKFLAHAEAIGIPLAALRGTPGYAGWMAPLAAALAEFQRVEIAGLKPHRLADEIAAITQTSGLLAIVTPRLGDRLERVGDRIAARLASVDDVLEPAHGDFYDDQAIASGRGLALIDLDEIRLSHPAIDAGNVLAHLASGAARGEHVAGARASFRERMLDLRPELANTLDLFEAAALLKLAPGPFRRLEPDWPQGIETILHLAESLLDDGSTSRSPAAVDTIDDPALPHLAEAMDPTAMTRRLGCVLGDARVSGTRLVRHKPGRRAIVAYDLDTGVRLYGKTFASERGPRVYRIAQRICAARGFGPDVALPEPVAWVAGLKLLVQRAVAGLPVESAWAGGDAALAALAARIADALHRFHASGLDLGRTHDLAKELSPLAMRTDAVGAQVPELGDAARTLHDRIMTAGHCEFGWRTLPVHRDFYHDQVLIDGDRLAVLDLDDAAMSEPAIDIANFAAHLRLLGFQRPDAAPALAHVEAAFLQRATGLDPDLDPALLRFLMAATMLRLAGIHVSRANGLAVARQLLDAATTALGDGIACPTADVPDRRAVRQ